MAKRQITPPPLHGPTAKEKKYDRQLRLWAASGQEALEDAHVLLLNSGPGVVGVEILKNLILPGVGSFTIVDENEVVEEDLGINFFLTDNSLGHPRASETCKYLMELNPDVNGHPVQQTIEKFLSEPNALDEYSLILFVAPPSRCRENLNKVSQYCIGKSLPLFYIHSLGLYSHFSVQLPSAFPIIDTHPDPASTQDLRLLQPWPELTAFAESKTQNLDSLSDHDHGHIPYLVLLLHFIEEWKESHNGNPPSDYKEKKGFKSLIESKARTNNPEGGEENFDEAAAAVLKSLNKPSLPGGLREIFEELAVRNKPNEDTANFWLIAQAIKDFYSKHHSLPLPGALPDMKAQSNDYIQLQNIYKAKARRDIDEVTALIRASEKNTLPQTHSPIDVKEIEAFCKGAAHVKLIKGQPLLTSIDDAAATPSRLASLYQTLKDDEESLLPISIAFLAYDSMLQDNTAQATSKDLDSLQHHTQRIIAKLSAAASTTNNDNPQTTILSRLQPILEELLRADGAELHNISALTGGMVAQEVIKVITKQYVPVDNTCMFDGIASKGGVVRV